MISSFEYLKEIAQNFIDPLLNDDFKSAANKFDDQMKNALDELNYRKHG